MLIITSWLCMILTVLIIEPKHLWFLSTLQSFMITLCSIWWVYLGNSSTNRYFLIDYISTPLTVLTCWLFPLTLLASQNMLQSEPVPRQRMFILALALIQGFTFYTFLTPDLLFFFAFYEASLIPIMIIISRWGSQERRLEAAAYLVFYTMLGAIPLLLWLLSMYKSHGTLMFNLMDYISMDKHSYPGLYWIACNTAFLMKLPMYCLHLWLPKAHVEAPVAGSMILAGTLLKLGGYGILRMSTIISENSVNHTLIILLIATLGVLATAILCLRQTDFKSLIAMSSVNHMNLFLIATVISTPASYAGAVIMMISHGLTSSAMFCLVNLAYERTNSRTMIMLRGALLIFPLTSLWWLLISLANMSFPPSINFAGELMVMFSIYDWSTITFLIVALNLIFTTAYTLYIFWSTQRGLTPYHLKDLPPSETREHILLVLHILPAALIIFKPELLMLMCH